MAYRKGKERAIELFQQGWAAADIAESLKVSLRTVQRWVAELRGIGVTSPTGESDANSFESPPVKNITTNPETVPHNDALSNPIYYPSKTWVNSAEILANDHFNTHRNIRLNLASLLDNQLQSPENLRAIHTLSLAVTRHLQGEREAASLNLLDVSRASELLQNYGFIVTRLDEGNNDIDNG